jgi:hypothetical protein
MTSNTSPEGLSDENRALVKRFYTEGTPEERLVIRALRTPTRNNPAR